jgi:aminomethyltransferase
VALTFMGTLSTMLGGIPCDVSRSGYTGEDGFEIALDAADAEGAAQLLLAEPEVTPAGLGARDTLRLEAGLPLYGNDLDETTSPVEAELRFTVAKTRLAAGDFPGAGRIARELADGPARRRVGIRPRGRAPVRAGAAITAEDGSPIGRVTSGAFGATVDAPIAMGYVSTRSSAPGARVVVAGRRGEEACIVAALPFVPHRYVR